MNDQSKTQMRTDAINLLKNISRMNDYEAQSLIINLLEKYSIIVNSETILNKKDFDEILNIAKYNMSHDTFPIKIDGVVLKESEQTNLCIIRATISTLNKLGLLKQLPKFNKTE